jgi:hypothetical protein
VLLLPLALAICVWSRPRLRTPCVLASAAFLISIVPLVRLMLTTGFESRAADISILNPDYLRPLGGFSLPLLVKTFLANMAMNLSPRYLFLSGDPNLRHGTQHVGEWSWLDMLALAAACALAIRAKLLRGRAEAVTLLLLVWGYISGIAPAALTHEGPHALRSIGAWPFLALASGFALGRALDIWPVATRAVIPIVVVAWSGWYYPDFFGRYPHRADGWFTGGLVAEARASRNASDVESSILRFFPNYPALAIRYYQLSSGFDRCGNGHPNP